MAKTLDSFPFTGRTSSKYPWDTWADGKIWELQRGTDFRGSTRSFQATASSYAQRRRIKVRTHTTEDIVVLQFYDREP